MSRRAWVLFALPSVVSGLPYLVIKVAVCGSYMATAAGSASSPVDSPAKKEDGRRCITRASVK
jgi:hypothetical protein